MVFQAVAITEKAGKRTTTILPSHICTDEDWKDFYPPVASFKEVI